MTRTPRITARAVKAPKLAIFAPFNIATFGQRLAGLLTVHPPRYPNLHPLGDPASSITDSEDYWISGPKRRGGAQLYGGSTPIEVDDDVREDIGEKSGGSQTEFMKKWPDLANAVDAAALAAR